MTAGGAQALAKGQGVLPGRRVLLAGAGPFLLPVAAQLDAVARSCGGRRGDAPARLAARGAADGPLPRRLVEYATLPPKVRRSSGAT